jgi:hypothetical protein
MNIRDFKKMAAGDKDEADESILIKPEAHESRAAIQEPAGNIGGHPNDPQRERREVVHTSRPKQIGVHVERRHLKLPSDKEWASTLKKIFAEGRI